MFPLQTEVGEIDASFDEMVIRQDWNYGMDRGMIILKWGFLALRVIERLFRCAIGMMMSVGALIKRGVSFLFF